MVISQLAMRMTGGGSGNSFPIGNVEDVTFTSGFIMHSITFFILKTIHRENEPQIPTQMCH